MFSNEAAELALDGVVVVADSSTTTSTSTTKTSTTSSCIHHLYCLDALRAEKVESRFLVGTKGTTCNNSQQQQTNKEEQYYLQLVRFHSDTNQLGLDATIAHPIGPIRKVCTSPNDPSLVMTIAQHQPYATLWKLPTDVLQRGTDADDAYGTYGADNSTTNYHRRHGHQLDDDDNDNDDQEEEEQEGDDDYHDHLHHPQAKTVSSMDELTRLGTTDTTTTTTTTTATTNTTTITSKDNVADIAWKDDSTWDDSAYDTDTDGGGRLAGSIATMTQAGTVTQWDWTTSTAIHSTTIAAAESNPSSLSWNCPPHIAWDPHSNNTLAISYGSTIELLDWRQQQSSPILVSSSCHRYGVTDLEYNPNKPHVLTSCGQDGHVKFWDLRCTTSLQPSTNHHHHHDNDYYDGTTTTSRTNRRRPLLLVARGGHSHWVSRVSYNPCHDQLIVSAGTDGVVQLWRMSTISSAPLLVVTPTGAGGTGTVSATGAATRTDATTTTTTAPAANTTTTTTTFSKSSDEAPNASVARYEHYDSVYALAWSAADAWIYMTGGYDGKVVLHHVPSKEKYKILL